MNFNLENINMAISKIDSAINILNEAKNLQKDCISKVSDKLDVISECLCGSNVGFNNEYEYVVSKLFFLKKKLIDMVNTGNVSLLEGVNNNL